ncbi:glycosyltransferase [Corynebacterium lubricantis]|uniref:glycosyltransferase n=1 Tax=Corynebacterium lubricantis TaxID=541095 RepID=UPI00037C9792|nr:glycosyltransferase [Corynebacterium lubricantis]
MSTLAVLLTVYRGTDATALELALDSLAAQTRPADEIVIVEDGPHEVSETIHAFVAKHPEARTVVLKDNVGSGLASQAGLTTIASEYLARLDSDDVAKPERFAVQLDYLEKHPEVAAVGTAMEEFRTHPGDGQAVRALPTDGLEKYVKINSPINNPSVMMRTEAVKAVGGYKNIKHMEDYDLYARLVAGGYGLANLEGSLTYFRVSPEQFSRRTTGMFAAEREMQRNLVSYGLVSKPRATMNLVVRTLYRALPLGLLQRAYAKLFHR